MDGVTLGNEGYIYLIDGNGEIIYHPRAQLIDSGLEHEIIGLYRNTGMGSIRKPFMEKKGNYRKISRLHRLEADRRSPRQTVSLNSLKTQLLVVFVAAFILFLMSLVNSYISSRITTPIRKLELSVNEN